MDFSSTDIKQLAVFVCRHLSQCQIDVVLVGGLAVEIYSENLYLTKDIDLVNTNYTKPKALHGAMAELGFVKQGRVYSNPSTGITVEFPPAPLSVGDSPVSEVETLPCGDGEVTILSAVDIVKDRIAAYIHWRDTQSLVQALTVMLKHTIEPQAIRDFCLHEGTKEQFEELALLHGKLCNQAITDMCDVEQALITLRLERL